MKTKEREIEYDAIRVISMIFVIMVHTPNSWINGIWKTALDSVLLLCNGMFFMVSGKFNLSTEFSETKDYLTFYKKRFIGVVVPFIIVSFIYTFIELFKDNFFYSMSFVGVLKKLYLDLMCNNASIHLWFMFVLIGLLLSTPFLSKMLHAMTEGEQAILMLISIIWSTISIYLTQNLEIGFSYSGWLFSGWIIYYIAGYYYTIMEKRVNKKRLYLIGIVCYVITVLCKTFIPNNFLYSYDLSPMYFCFTFAVFVFLKEHIVIAKNSISSRIIAYFAKYSYLVYLVHYDIAMYVTPRIALTGTVWGYFVSVFVTLIISVAISILFSKLIIKPIDNLLMRIIDKRIESGI